MITRDSRTKSSHGGKRRGAGRPKAPDSIRSLFAEAKEIGAHHSYTLYEIWRDTYISKNAHVVVNWLSMEHDRRERDAVNRDKTFISRNAALEIAHLDEQAQLGFLAACFPQVLYAAGEQCGNSGHELTRLYGKWCWKILNDHSEQGQRKEG